MQIQEMDPADIWTDPDPGQCPNVTDWPTASVNYLTKFGENPKS